MAWNANRRNYQSNAATSLASEHIHVSRERVAPALVAPATGPIVRGPAVSPYARVRLDWQTPARKGERNHHPEREASTTDEHDHIIFYCWITRRSVGTVAVLRTVPVGGDYSLRTNVP